MAEAHVRYRTNAEGAQSDVYPALARVPPRLFGLCVVGTTGNGYGAGHAGVEFTTMSVAKPFVFALVTVSPGQGARHVRSAARRGGQQREGQARGTVLARRLGLDLFASEPHAHVDASM